MKKSSWLNSFFTGVFFIGAISVQAADCNSQNGTVGTPSNFDTNGTWSCGHAPTSNADNITVSHYVTRSTGSLTYQWGTQTITINSGGYLKIIGDLTLKGSGNKIIINNGGTLEVTGKITIENGGVTLDVESGGTLKAGTIDINSGSTLTVKTNGTVNGTATIGTLNVNNNTNAKFVNNGTTNVTANMLVEGPTTNTGILDVDGNLTISSSGSASFSTTGGSVKVDGNASSANTFKVGPSAYVYIKGNFTTTSNEGLTVGTDVAPTPYADMVIKGSLLSASSGDLRVKDNGRLAIFGDYKKTTSNGGILMTIEDKGQVYVHGNLDMSSVSGGGGGNIIDNQNTVDPYGFYYNGTPSNVTVDTNKGNSTTMQTTNPTFYNWIATQPGNPFNTMPITLKYFRIATEQSNGILLEWATAMEKNFDYFEIQVSKHGNEFEPIVKIKGKGESSVLAKYQYLDSSPANGRNYYRLKSVDLDGTFEYSSVVAGVWSNKIDAISVYPNPVINRKARIALPEGFPEIQKVFLFDQTSSVVWENSGDSPLNVIEFPENIGTGIYFMSLYTKTRKYNARVILR